MDLWSIPDTSSWCCRDNDAATRPSRDSRSGFLASLDTDHNPSDDDGSDNPFSDGTPGTLDVMAAQSTSRPRLPEPQWSQLSKPGKETWHKLTDTDKSVIIQAHVAARGTLDSNNDTDAGESTPCDPDAPPDTPERHVHCSDQGTNGLPNTASKAHPGDPRRLLSSKSDNNSKGSRPDSKSSLKAESGSKPPASRSGCTAALSPHPHIAQTDNDFDAVFQTYWATQETSDDESFHDAVPDFS